jgi:deoxyribodipyrimidine photolyase-related protein
MIYLLFPTQLFHNINHLKDATHIYLIEEPRYFTDFKFHKLKLAYHRASMKKYYDKLKKKSRFNITYVEYQNVNKKFYKEMSLINTPIFYMDTCDIPLNAKLHKLIKNIVQIPSINFLIKKSKFQDIKNLIYSNDKYSHEKFYKIQRKTLNILMKKDNPELNKWSFDNENRKALPKNKIVPPIQTKAKNNKYIKEAIIYVKNNFPNNYGSLDNMIYPIDHSGSILWLHNFLDKRLKDFGEFQDAVSTDSVFVYHSVISPMMNIGLLTDSEVVKISYDYYLNNKKKISIQSFEGFIRQVIGWRNYVYLIYNLERENLFESNQLNHVNKINENWWRANLGIEPVDFLINKIVDYSYAHHIERLMYLGNFMLLCRIDPKEVYKIFMEWTIDAFDWVMVPNIFGMSQYASSLMMTRPYFSSSNYVRKMSNFKKGDWSLTWDALYYSFIGMHADIFKHNYAISRQVILWEKKSSKAKKEYNKIANDYIDEYILS